MSVFCDYVVVASVVSVLCDYVVVTSVVSIENVCSITSPLITSPRSGNSRKGFAFSESMMSIHIPSSIDFLINKKSSDAIIIDLILV